MNRADFYLLLVSAQRGENEALEALLKLYNPMIEKYCYVNGVYDEDLRQYIWLHIALNINKFPV